MNKYDIISVLNRYNFNKDKFIIISGAALVLMDIIDKTSDIDLYVTNDYYNELLSEYKCSFKCVNSFGVNVYNIDNVIDFSFSFCPYKYDFICDYRVSSLYDVYVVKSYLNRDKDREIIKKLEKYI